VHGTCSRCRPWRPHVVPAQVDGTVLGRSVTTEIGGAALTTYCVTVDGSAFQLDLRDADGRPASVSPPMEWIRESAMALLQIAGRALRARSGNDSIVPPSGARQVTASGAACFACPPREHRMGWRSRSHRDRIVSKNVVDD